MPLWAFKFSRNADSLGMFKGYYVLAFCRDFAGIPGWALIINSNMVNIPLYVVYLKGW
jgi:hypothetical protein